MAEIEQLKSEGNDKHAEIVSVLICELEANLNKVRL